MKGHIAVRPTPPRIERQVIQLSGALNALRDNASVETSALDVRVAVLEAQMSDVQNSLATLTTRVEILEGRVVALDFILSAETGHLELTGTATLTASP